MERERGLFFDGIFLTGVAISSLAFLLVAVVPVVGSAAILFIPLPVLYFYARTGRTKGTAVLILSLAVSFAILKLLGEQVNFPFLILLGLLGAILSEALRKNYPLEKTLLSSVAALITLGAAFLLYASIRAGDTPWQLIGASVARKIEESIRLYAQIDPSSEQAGLIKDNAAQIIAFIQYIFPAIAIVGASVTVWLNILAARAIFKRYTVPFPDFGDLTCWKPPERLIWVPIAAGLLILMPTEGVQFTGFNLLIVSLFVYFLGGLAIVAFYFRRKKAPPLLRFMFYFVIVAQQYITLIVIVAGLFDMWIDFRKFNKTTEDSAG